MKKYIHEDFIKIVISLLLFVLSFLIKIDIYKWGLIFISYVVISYEMYIKTFHNIKKGIIFDENFLMIIATLGAFYISSYTEAVLVMLLYQIGEYLSDLAVNRSKESITKLMDLRVEEINIEGKGKVKLKEAKINDVFLVRPGEKIALDGIVIEGESFLDTASLTGESTPRKVKKDEKVLSGCINKDSLLKVKATSTSKTSTAQRIMDLIENSNELKTNTETFITKFARIYTPVICLIAILLGLIPTLLGYDYHVWIYRSLVFLVTSCPCALVISVPLGYFCGIGKESTEGIIIKGSKELENLTKIDYILLDKTGTITEGVFEVVEINTKMKEKDFLKILASAEKNSIHPIAKAINEKYEGKLENVTEYKEISGQGIVCIINHQKILVGNNKLLKKNNISFEEIDKIGTVIYLAIDNEYQGDIVISDKIRKDSKNLKTLEKEIGKELIILSGDSETITAKVAKEVGISKSLGNLLPEDKVKIVKEYKEKGSVIFVGDGINDAPVLKIADIGISMGNIGSDAAIEASDIVLMHDDLSKIKTAMDIAKITKKKVTESIVFALTIKFIVLLLGIFGKSTILLAVLADVGVTILVILNVLGIFFEKIK